MKKNELDLHGVRHGQVQGMLDKFLFEHFNRNTQYVRIITGNSERMKQIVNETLKEYDLVGEVDFLNFGQLNVTL